MNEKTPVQREHGPDVPLREYIERVLEEREKANNFRAKETEKALLEARASAERALDEAKEAADRVMAVLTKRIEQLESGGAPFASRLDESLTELKADVDVLLEDAVRTKVLEAMEKSRAEEARQQKRTSKAAFATGAGALLLSMQRIITDWLSGGG